MPSGLSYTGPSHSFSIVSASVLLDCAELSLAVLARILPDLRMRGIKQGKCFARGQKTKITCNFVRFVSCIVLVLFVSCIVLVLFVFVVFSWEMDVKMDKVVAGSNALKEKPTEALVQPISAQQRDVSSQVSRSGDIGRQVAENNINIERERPSGNRSRSVTNAK